MTVLDYHKLRKSERQAWNPANLEAAARTREINFPERVLESLPGTEERSGNLDTVELSPLDEKITVLCQLYLAASQEERTFIRSMIDRRKGGTLRAFGPRAAVLGMRGRSEEAIRLGLVANAIDDLASGDARDTLVAITPLFHAARKIVSDAAALFQEVAAISGPAFSALLLDFAARDPSLQTLRCMGWTEIETPTGIGLKRL